MTNTFNILKTIKGATISLLVLLALSACEEVIDIDLNSSDPVLVADGAIEIGETASIRLSYTSDYFDENTPVSETEAEVLLTSSSGAEEPLMHTGEGYYTGNTIIGTVGDEYTLSMKVNGDTFEGSTRLLTPSTIQKIKILEADMPGKSDDQYELEITFTNNVEEENYYLIKYFVNGSLQEEDFSVLSHEYFANEEVVTYNPMRQLFDEGDEVEVQLFSIDEGTYTYYSQLQDISGEGPGGSTPFNPQSNLGDNIMGYFRAWSMDSQTITIQP
ncbi:MAG: DUF4249 domain-containing protein [Marinilabiliaceae bacterium]|nr:DUF4249 domain-containing protein [Marinilabiliaceae bacterium]